MSEPFSRELPCELTDVELLTHSKDLAKLNQDLVEKETRKKEVASDYAAQLSAITSTIQVESRKVATGIEYRFVECQWVPNFTEDINELFRLDTGEIIETRAITQQDRQAELEI